MTVSLNYAKAGIQELRNLPVGLIIALGDSVTAGTISTPAAATTPDTPDSQNRKGYLEKSLAFTNDWLNFSFGGISTLSFTTDDDYERFWKVIEDIKPTDVLDFLGTNDSLTNYATFIARKEAMWQRLKDLGVKRIHAATIMPRPDSTYGLSQLPTIANGGNGDYGNNLTFDVTVSGGTSTQASVVNVTTNGSGVVTIVNSITTIGNYSVRPTLSGNAVTGGAGTGLTLDLVYGKCLTAAHQTAGSGNSATQTYNDSLRSGAYSEWLFSYIETAAIVENPDKMGTWLPGKSGDGTHVNSSSTTDLIAAVGPQMETIRNYF